jgi:GntR family transcriptional regulator
MPSYAEIATRHAVSDMVVRKAIELLKSQGLVRAARRRGIFVTDRPNLVRISPERQMEDPEDIYGHESSHEVQIDRQTTEVPATEDVAEALGVNVGDTVSHMIVRASEDGHPISISDSYQPLGVDGIADATILEETIADRLPAPSHAEWLNVAPGDLVKAVRQHYMAADGRVVMLSDVSYPRDRYDAFVFRMSLVPDEVVSPQK